MPDSAQGSNKHLRIGGQDAIITYNRESDDAVLPDLSSQGFTNLLLKPVKTTDIFQGTATSVPLAPGSWQCFEYHVSSDGTIETWLDSKVIPGLTIKAGVTNSHASIWQGKSYKPQITGVYFGWEAYGGDANTFWFDDISTASTRPGCLGNSTI